MSRTPSHASSQWVSAGNCLELHSKHIHHFCTASFEDEPCFFKGGHALPIDTAVKSDSNTHSADSRLQENSRHKINSSGISKVDGSDDKGCKDIQSGF